VASRVTARPLQGWTSLGAPPIPSGVGSDDGEKRKEKNNRRQECPGTEEDWAV
jgi:hypothetical protein